MSRQGKFKVPDEFRSIVLDLTVKYLMEQPKDVIEFALQHFSKLKAERDQKAAAAATSKPPPEENLSDDDEGEF